MLPSPWTRVQGGFSVYSADFGRMKEAADGLTERSIISSVTLCSRDLYELVKEAELPPLCKWCHIMTR